MNQKKKIRQFIYIEKGSVSVMVRDHVSNSDLVHGKLGVIRGRKIVRPVTQGRQIAVMMVEKNARQFVWFFFNFFRKCQAL